MNNNFDLFATSESDNLQEEIATHSYSWTNKLTWVLVGSLVFVSGGSAGIWYSNAKSSSAQNSNQASQGRNQSGGGGIGNASSGMSGSGFAIGNQQGNRGQGGGLGRGTVGVIKKITGKVIEMETSDGRVLTVTADDQTRILATTSDSFASLRIGDSVSVQGEISADGSIATNLISKGDALGSSVSGGSGSANANSSSGGSATPGKSVKVPKSGPGATNGKGKKNNQNKQNQQPSESGGAANSQTSNSPSGQGQGPQQGNRGGGALRNPEFRACLTENGVEIPQGERPDMSDPKVSAAFEKCRPLLPQGGPGGGQGGQSN